MKDDKLKKKDYNNKDNRIKINKKEIMKLKGSKLHELQKKIIFVEQKLN